MSAANLRAEIEAIERGVEAGELEAGIGAFLPLLEVQVMSIQRPENLDELLSLPASEMTPARRSALMRGVARYVEQVVPVLVYMYRHFGEQDVLEVLRFALRVEDEWVRRRALYLAERLVGEPLGVVLEREQVEQALGQRQRLRLARVFAEFDAMVREREEMEGAQWRARDGFVARRFELGFFADE